jgi:hypothetical protein
MFLRIFAHHISELLVSEGRFELHPCAGVVAKVTITPSSAGHIWASVVINGVQCGNRHGGVRHFVDMVNAVAPEIVWE